MSVDRLRGEITWFEDKLARQRRRDSLRALELRAEIAGRLRTLRDQGAEAWLRDLAADQARVFGPRHRATLMTWFFIALRCEETGRADEALSLFSWLAETYAFVWGAEDPVVGECRAAVGATLYRAGRFAPAIEVYRALGRDYLVEVAQAQLELGRFDDAEQTLRDAGPELQERAQAVRRAIQAELGAPGPEIAALRGRLAEPEDPAAPAEVRASLAYALVLNGEVAEAVSLAESVLEARLGHLGPEDQLTWEARLLLGWSLAETDRLGDAEHYARAVLASAPWPPGHPGLLRALATVARVHFRREEWAEAVEAYEFAVEGYELVLGSGHRETVKSVAALAAAREAADG